MECPICKAIATGAYCASCGSPLEGASCRGCMAPLLAGARYCTQCGEPVQRRRNGLALYVGGSALVVLLITLITVGGGRRAAGPGGGGPIARSGAVAPTDGTAAVGPPLTGTPREQADRLFNRVMQSISAGDSEQAAFFLPMAILAYRQAGELDADGLYHLSVLETASGDALRGLATAERILEADPDHLLALGAAGHAAAEAGQWDSARRYYSHLLAIYDAEQARGRAEYLDHAPILPEYRARAEQLLGR